MDAFLSLDHIWTTTEMDGEAFDPAPTSTSEPEGIPLSYEHGSGSTGHFFCVIA
ncbi:hypothetical protein BD311DRAFT_756189 [Dichomitus squalens]|uniref:Pheromone n=1 Tax=Dichomitus squalens TaxID=114155 RepID=A0A4Q9MPP9_9APHY|nr:hypothetical protein BD311DRAFT_756189 [Dichomitus squalens]